MFRVIRSVWRAVTRRPMWNDNREDWRSWADPEHPIRWAWVKHGERRTKYPALLRQPEFAHLQVVHVRSPRETRQLLAAAASAQAGRSRQRPTPSSQAGSAA